MVLTDPANLSEQYDQVLRAHPRQVVEAQRLADDAMVARRCLFDGRPLPYFLKPYFLSESQQVQLDRVATCLVGVLEKITQFYFTRPELRPHFSLSPEAAALIEMDPGYRRNIVISRPDAFLDEERLQFLEFNCDSPAGAGYTDVQEDVLVETFPMREMAKAVTWQRRHRMQATLEALLAAYREFGGTRSQPNIAIVDWKHVKTRDEFALIQHHFQSQGHETVVADPREMVIQHGELQADGVRIDLIYRRAIFLELLDQAENIKDLLRAYREHKVCMANSLRSRLATSKSMLSILTNSANDILFTEVENLTKREYIPWTRRVIDAEKIYGGKRRLLNELVLDHQADMVLKPADSYGGRDVHIGREATPQDWRALAQRALASEEDWVVQEYVPIPTMTVPVVTGDRMELAQKKVNINPFILQGSFAGAVARLSDQSVINVSASGGLVPVIHYAAR